MSENRNHQDDDPVTRAVVATRQMPIPEGPAAATVSRTLAAVQEAATRQPLLLGKLSRFGWRSKAAALLGIAGSALVAYAMLSTTSHHSVAWAAAIDKILSAKTLISEITIQAGGENGIVGKGRMLFDEANDIRADMHVQFQNQEDDITLILNMKAGKSIVFVKGQKTAVTDLMTIGDQNFLKQTAFERLKALTKESTRSLGKKQVDGVQCEGFEIRRGITIRLWINAATGDPVRLEESGLVLPQPLGRGEVVVSNFKFDEKLDPSLFEVEPPEGYTVVKSPITVDLTAKPANDVATLLRFYAKRSDGRFPERLIDPDDPIFKKMDITGKFDDKPTPENLELEMVQGGVVMRLRIYLEGHKQGTDYQYYSGIKLGEKDRIVFWSRNTKTGEYTAAFGDLRVEKIDKEKVPAAE